MADESASRSERAVALLCDLDELLTQQPSAACGAGTSAENARQKYITFVETHGALVRELAIARSEQQPIVDVALCEIPHITLKEGPLYRFTKMPFCAACAAYASP